jgi:hypothetical protein
MRRALLTAIIVAAAVLALAVASPVREAAAQSGAGGGSSISKNLTRFNSRSYEVFTDMPVADVKPIAAHMDAVFAEYVKRFKDFPQKVGMPVRLYVFGTEAAYLRTLKGKGFSADNTSGVFFFNGDEGGLATFVEGQSSLEMYHVLQHEGFHQFAFLRIGDKLPQWANEGLAEYFGESILVKGALRTGVAPENRIQAMALAIRSKTNWPFETLLTMSDEGWNEKVEKADRRAGMMYDQSWSMIHFLVEGDNGKYRKALGDYVMAVSKGLTSEQAFKKAFGDAATPQQFEEAWKRYVQNDMQPDAVSTTLERLEFLVFGARRLAESGVEVKSMDDLERELRARKASVTITREGIRREMSASDPAMFDDPPRDDPKKATSIEVTPPQREGWPVGFRVKGLKVGIRLLWEVPSGGGGGSGGVEALRSKVEFE